MNTEINQVFHTIQVKFSATLGTTQFPSHEGLYKLVSYFNLHSIVFNLKTM